ncbi:hypothetical protein ACJZ2D_008929 [Fusarium nematophilum]
MPVPLVPRSPSTSRSSPSRATSTAKSTRRSASPVKSFTLEELQKPVRYIEFANNPNAQLPVEIRQLYRDIKDLAVDREAFIPKSLKAPLLGILPDAKAR